MFIIWEASTDNGNRLDLIYTITQNVTDDIVTTANTNITLMGLIPFVSYEIRVTADNGVSSQDGNEEGRTLSISIMTLEGGDLLYELVYVCVYMCMFVCVCALNLNFKIIHPIYLKALLLITHECVLKGFLVSDVIDVL